MHISEEGVDTLHPIRAWCFSIKQHHSRSRQEECYEDGQCHRPSLMQKDLVVGSLQLRFSQIDVGRWYYLDSLTLFLVEGCKGITTNMSFNIESYI